jgi:hypothetical protein
MGISGQRHARAVLYPRGKTPGTHCTGGWVVPRAGLGTEARGKSFVPAGDRTSIARSSKSVARHYTDRATPAPKVIISECDSLTSLFTLIIYCVIQLCRHLTTLEKDCVSRRLHYSGNTESSPFPSCAVGAQYPLSLHIVILDQLIRLFYFTLGNKHNLTSAAATKEHTGKRRCSVQMLSRGHWYFRNNVAGDRNHAIWSIMPCLVTDAFSFW